MTEAEILDRLALYLAAEKKILEGNQSSTVAGTTFTRADLGQIRSEIKNLRAELAMLQGQSFAPIQVFFGGRR